MESVTVLSPNGGLGAGFPESSLQAGLEMNPDVIAMDAGSIDPGPYYLGAAKTTESHSSVKRDLSLLIPAAKQRNIPLIIGSVVTTGAKPNLEWAIDIAKEIAKEKHLTCKLAKIEADIDKDYLKNALAQGKVRTFQSRQALVEKDIDEATHIVAQMGVEPFIEALKLQPDIIFENFETYQAVKDSQVINRELIAKLYGLKNLEDIKIYEYNPACAIKITIPRLFPAGSVGDTDMLGAQQHAPLYDIEVNVASN